MWRNVGRSKTQLNFSFYFFFILMRLFCIMDKETCSYISLLLCLLCDPVQQRSSLDLCRPCYSCLYLPFGIHACVIYFSKVWKIVFQKFKREFRVSDHGTFFFNHAFNLFSTLPHPFSFHPHMFIFVIKYIYILFIFTVLLSSNKTNKTSTGIAYKFFIT